MASKKKKPKRDTKTLERAVEENRPSYGVQVRMSRALIDRIYAYKNKLQDQGFVINFSAAVRSLVEQGLKAQR